MSLKLVFALLALSGVVGGIIGYVFRMLLALSKKGSVEHDLKQRVLRGEEEAKKITLRAEEEAADILKNV